MYRAQILLRPEQHRRLLRLSRDEGRSLSEVTRTLLDEALASHQSTVWKARRSALEKLRVLRAGTARRGGSAPTDLVNGSRSEREDERPWR